MKQVLALMILFTKKCKKEVDSNPGSVENLEVAEKLMVKMAQHQNFKGKLKTLDPHKSNSSKEPKWFIRLDPFKDNDGIIRVGGRFRNSDQPC